MIFSSNFLPPIAYFVALLDEEKLYINSSEQYLKQSYRNRAYILGVHQIESLVVPVKKSPNHTPIKSIKIDYSENWVRVHKKTIQNCYRKSPFFAFYDYLIFPIFERKHVFLLDLNQEIMSLCLKLTQLEMSICHEEFDFFENKDRFISFNAKSRNEILDFYMPKSYTQNFGFKFEGNLSILDLLFMKGPQTKSFLLECKAGTGEKKALLYI